jgi:hypothetical protein
VNPASQQLATQLTDYRGRLAHLVEQRERWRDSGDAGVLAAFEENTGRLRRSLERVTLTALADNARPAPAAQSQ